MRKIEGSGLGLGKVLKKLRKEIAFLMVQPNTLTKVLSNKGLVCPALTSLYTNLPQRLYTKEARLNQS